MYSVSEKCDWTGQAELCTVSVRSVTEQDRQNYVQCQREVWLNRTGRTMYSVSEKCDWTGQAELCTVSVRSVTEQGRQNTCNVTLVCVRTSRGKRLLASWHLLSVRSSFHPHVPIRIPSEYFRKICIGCFYQNLSINPNFFKTGQNTGYHTWRYRYLTWR